MLSLLLVGFLLGIRHALEADHIATVASLVSNHPSRSQMIRQGFAWGIGHSLTLLLIGSVVLLSDHLIPQQVASSLEMAVGAMMIILGIDVLRRARRSKVHFHTHRHADGRVHFHAHSHGDAYADNYRDSNEARPPRVQHDKFTPIDHSTLNFSGRFTALDKGHAQLAHNHTHSNPWPIRALSMGLLHGMAGSAALVLLFVDQVSSVAAGVLYILLFGAGSILGMLAFSLVISVPLSLTAKHMTRLHNGLQIGIGVITSGIGLMLLTNS